MKELFTRGPSFWRHKPEFGKEKEIEISSKSGKFSALIKYQYFYLRKGNIQCPYGLYFTIQIKKNISHCHAVLQINKEEILDLFFKNNVIYDKEKWNDSLYFNHYWQTNVILFLDYSDLFTDIVYFPYRLQRENYLTHLQEAIKKLLEKIENTIDQKTVTVNTEIVERTYQFTIF